MKIYVGVTDEKWFRTLKALPSCDEVNFWMPGARLFKALEPNGMFLFKLHKPNNFIVGGGIFVRSTVLPTFLAWDAFGAENGASSLQELNEKIRKYRKDSIENPQIGCIILTEPFFFERDQWIPIPSDWSDNIVSGKRYDTEVEPGRSLYETVTAILSQTRSSPIGGTAQTPVEELRYTECLTKHRLGQGAFRILVTDAYGRRGAITGERTLPVLEAAHIKSFSENGPNEVSNGILLRSDFHKLYDEGYIAITTDYHVEVSRHLHDDFSNGKEYYRYQGQKLQVLPDSQNQPLTEYLNWHNKNIYRG